MDEMGTNTSLSPRYAYSPKGRRAYAQVPRNRGANTTLLASMSLEGMGSCLAVEGTTTAKVFEAYVEQALAPSLRHGQIVVVYNLLQQGPQLLTQETSVGDDAGHEALLRRSTQKDRSGRRRWDVQVWGCSPLRG